MQDFNNKLAIISFRIWFFSLLINTTIGSLILGGFNASFIDYFIFGALFGGFFSLPIFIIIWVLLYYFVSRNYPSKKIIKQLVTIAIVLIIIDFSCFVYYLGSGFGNVYILAILAVSSGIIAILSQMRPIKYVCTKRDTQFFIGESLSI